MSKHPVEGKQVAISINDIVARINVLQKYIELLQTQIELLLSEINELKLTQTALKEAGSSNDVYISTNRLGTAFIKGVLAENWDKEILLHIGLEYFIIVDKEKALKHISEKLRARTELLNKTQMDYNAAINEYNQLNTLLSVIYNKIQQEKRTGGAAGVQG